MKTEHALGQLAYAGLDIPDLVNGVIGRVDIEFDPDTPSSEKESRLREVVEGYQSFFARGWKRQPDKEQGRFTDRPEIEYRVFKHRPQIEGKAVTRWATVLLCRWMGMTATFTCSEQEPW